MTGRNTVIIIIIFTILALALAWFLLQYVIEEFDLDTTTGIAKSVIRETTNL